MRRPRFARLAPKRRRCSRSALVLGLGLVAASWTSPATGARTHQLSLAQAVELALRNNRRVLGAREQVAAAEAGRKSVRGQIGPRLSVEATVNVWDDKLPFDLGIDTASIPAPFDTLFASDLVVRDQVTTQVNVTLAQPLTPLYQAIKGHQAATLGRDAARLGLQATADAIAAATTSAYIGVIRARTSTEIARTAVAQVRAHLGQAQAFFSAGLASRTDVLKAELALAQAEEGLIKAEAGLSLAETGLALVTGVPRGDRIDPVQHFADPPPAVGRSLEQCTRQALQQRPDLRAGAAKVAIAHKARDIARWEMVPQLVALANYGHATGAELMYPEHTFFVGGMLKWNVWEWGATYYKARQARHQVAREQLEHEEAAASVELEVKQAYLELGIADKTLKVATKGVAHAEEAYRIEQARFERNAATTTDVLDAQLALTRARLSRSNALYGWYDARAKLVRAIGSAK